MSCGRYIQVKLREHVGAVFADGRRISRHGRYGNIHMVPEHDALVLIDAGQAKLPRHMSLPMLRESVAGRQ